MTTQGPPVAMPWWHPGQGRDRAVVPKGRDTAIKCSVCLNVVQFASAVPPLSPNNGYYWFGCPCLFLSIDWYDRRLHGHVPGYRSRLAYVLLATDWYRRFMGGDRSVEQ
jgi:hypothetical protein